MFISFQNIYLDQFFNVYVGTFGDLDNILRVIFVLCSWKQAFLAFFMGVVVDRVESGVLVFLFQGWSGCG